MTAAMLVTACGVGSVSAGDDAVPAVPAATTVVKHQTTCPVMGGEVNGKVFADYHGKRVFFCCNACPALFKRDPAKYIRKMEADGIALAKTPQAATTNAPAAVQSQGKDEQKTDDHSEHH